MKALPVAAHDRASIMQVIQVESREEKGRPLGRDHINGIEGFWSYAKN